MDFNMKHVVEIIIKLENSIICEREGDRWLIRTTFKSNVMLIYCLQNAWRL